MKTPARQARSAGFTLIELLAVILILGILAGVLLVNLRDTQGAALVSDARMQLGKIGAAIDHYASEHGSAPLSSFTSDQEVANDGTNVGVEALVVTLFSNRFEGGGLLEDERDALANTDGDSSTRRLTDFDSRELLEFVDPWGNPIAYIERNDYAATNRPYLTVDAETSLETTSVATAFKNPRTGQYYRPTGYQLISAGPDGRFGTADDVTTFDRD
jgi:prepilin-type N-terminal cleavage/methylation domain-containing protein